MFKDKLSDEIKYGIVNAIEARIINPLRKTYQNDEWLKGKHFWTDQVNNWSVVCWTGVIFAVMTTLNNQTERDFYVEQGLKRSQNFFHAFQEDGFYSEGELKFQIITHYIIFL